MITETNIFGISLHTQFRRRAVVIGYYCLVSAFPIVGLIRGHHFDIGILLPQIMVLGGMLGGIRSGGPVKRFEGDNLYGADLSATTPNYPVQVLNLSGRIPPYRHLSLDEREQAERDHAHYRAYAVLRWVLSTTAILFLLLIEMNYRWPLNYAPILLWSLVIFTLSLPQVVILWSEPDAPGAGDLALVSERS